MLIYGLKNCDSCRKASKALPGARLHDVRMDGMPLDVLRAAFDTFGKTVLNTRSTTWRNLDEAQRAGDPIALIQEHPALMKRPLISVDKQLFLGWTKEVEAGVKALL